MPLPDFIILYVQDTGTSEQFYADLLGRPSVESSPNFVMFALNPGTMLGLWAIHDIEPRPQGRAGCSELGITVQDRAQVDGLFESWSRKGLSILQKPIGMDFGYTFTIEDPDGHRIRVFAPAQA